MSRLTATVLGLGGLLGGCDATLPGEVVGAYSVVMHLEANDCGGAVTPFPDGERYPVELRQEGGRGYWRLSKGAPVQGELADAGFRFTHKEAFELGAMDAGTLGCTVLREEELVGVLDGLVSQADGGLAASDDDGGLRGEHRVGFRADPGGRCRDQRGPLREFEQLPCQARYRLEGTPREPF